MGSISAYESLFAELSAEAVLAAELNSPGTITGSISVSPQRPYVDLPELTNPATAAEIVLGYQAIDKNSYRLTGTLDLDALKEESYSEGYEAGKTDGYSEGYTDGVASVDTQSYYDSGYAVAEEAVAEALAALTEVE
ncbi:MAG: hypothetical protein LUE31_03030 [Lachnospiraceae bacterium]|nr:hypothetical protein [Lachnospiraceae bacterium]